MDPMEKARERLAYETSRASAIESLKRAFGDGPVPLDVAAGMLPVHPEWLQYQKPVRRGKR